VTSARVICSLLEPSGQAFRGLKCDSFQARKDAEVFHVERGNVEAKMQCCDANHQILNGDGDSFCSLLAFYAPGNACDGQGDGMDDDAGEDIFTEGAATVPVASGSGPVNAVRQLNGANRRYS
jgi:hypothetical protein